MRNKKFMHVLKWHADSMTAAKPRQVVIDVRRRMKLSARRLLQENMNEITAHMDAKGYDLIQIDRNAGANNGRYLVFALREQ